MPFAFPSHQGLILPLWSRFPRAIDALGLSVGAAAPDIVDGVAGAFRGKLGQWLGHSLLGLVLLCVPAGLVLTWVVRRIGRPRRWLAHFSQGEPPRLGVAAALLRTALSVFAGALSHVVFDLVSHDNFHLLLPFYDDPKVFPDFWYVPWTSVDFFFYDEPYPIAPHTVVWFVLSILGIVLFVRALRRPPRVSRAPGDPS